MVGTSQRTLTSQTRAIALAINAIWFDRKHGTMQGGSSYHDDDYGIAW